MPLRQRPAFAALAEHHTSIESVHLRRLFDEDPEREEIGSARKPWGSTWTIPRTA